MLDEGLTVQLAGTRNATPFSVKVKNEDGEILFSDDRFLMDYRSRDAGRCKELVQGLKAKMAKAAAPPPPKLPTSFLESYLPTKVQYLASLQLSNDLRLKAESDALAMRVAGMKIAAPLTPTASVTSSCPDMLDVSDSEMPSRMSKYKGGNSDGCCEGDKGSCCD